jgi:hypothetical protein
MTLFAMEPMHIGDYVVLSLLCVTASMVGLAALVCSLVQGAPDPELENYADDPRPPRPVPGVPHA